MPYGNKFPKKAHSVPVDAILFVSRKFPPAIGGMERVASSLRGALQKNMLVESVIPTKPEGPRGYGLFEVLVKGAYRILRAPRNAIVLLQDGVLSPLVWFARLRRIPVVTIVHGLEVTYPNALYQAIVIPSLRRADRIVCVSEATRTECAKRSLPMDRTLVISNGVSAPDQGKRLRPGPVHPSGRTLLAVGRQVERKGLHWFLADVFPTLARRFSDLVLVLVGDGPLHSDLRILAAERGLSHRVTFLTQVDDETLANLYQDCDVFVMPNIAVHGDFEGFGMAAAEAMIMGCAVVVSDLEGLVQTVPNGEIGVRVPPGDAREFVRVTAHFLTHPQEGIALGEKAREYVLREFSWERVADKYERVFSELMEETLASQSRR